MPTGSSAAGSAARVIVVSITILAWQTLAWSAPVQPVGRPAADNVSVSRTPTGLDVHLTFAPGDVSLTPAGRFWRIDVRGCRSAAVTPGDPLLPARHVNVLLPAGASVQAVDVQADEMLLATDVLVWPTQPSVPVSTPLPAIPEAVEPDPVAYAGTSPVPAAVAELVGRHTMRGHHFVSLRINPVRYVPAAGELYLATRVTVQLALAWPGQVATALVADRGRDLFTAAVREIVVNGEMLDEPVAAAPTSGTASLTDEPATGTDYLIITSSALVGAFQPLADWRASHNGFTTAIVTTGTIGATYPGIDLQARIRACIQDYVYNHGTSYVVLGGDNTVVPDRDCRVTCGTYTESAMPTDLYYAGLDGNWDEDGDGIYGEADTAVGDEGDLAPDVYVGRIPVRYDYHASAYINKVIQFETNPIPADRMLLAGVHIGGNASPSYGPYADAERPTDAVDDGHLDFLSHSPVSDVEMWTRRMYRDIIQPYYQPATLGLLFDTLTSWDTAAAGDYPLNSSTLSYRLKQGWYHVFMMTHGSASSWSLESGSFTTSSATSLTGQLGVIYTGSCSTAMFDGSGDPCLSEAFLRASGGPVAYFGSSRYGWYSPDSPPAGSWTTGGTSMAFARDFYDQVFRLGSPGLAQAFYAHKAASAGWSGYNGAYRWLQFGINYQGDPALALAPITGTRTLTINIQGSGTVQVDPPGGTYEPGATVQLTAVPADAPWTFLRWQTDASGSSNPITVVMDQNRTVTAVFTVPGDINGDGACNSLDLLMLANSWNRVEGDREYNPACDINDDGTVNAIDLLMLAKNFTLGS